MYKHLYFLRHAPAVELGMEGCKSDEERVLSESGARKMKQVARGMRALDLAFDMVWTSPLIRAVQTAQITCKVLKLSERMSKCHYLIPGQSRSVFISALQKIPGDCHDLLVVGHEPSLSRWISFLTTGSDTLLLHFRKSGLAKLTLGEVQIEGNCASLEWILTPKQLIRMGQ